MEDALLELGLNDKEVTIYLLLLQKPHQTAQQIAEQTDIKRTNVYRILDNLLAKGLIAPEETPIRKFSVTDPRSLHTILKEQQQQLKKAASVLISSMPTFRSQFSLSLDKPGVVSTAGIEGFEQLLKDMVHSQTEVLLVASNDQPTDEAVLRRFQNLLLERKANSVRTRALFHNGQHRKHIRAKFSERGFDVKFIGQSPFKGEIIIYEDNVAFTVYDPSLITTIVTNPYIASTMHLLFEEVWSKADN